MTNDDANFVIVPDGYIRLSLDELRAHRVKARDYFDKTSDDLAARIADMQGVIASLKTDSPRLVTITLTIRSEDGKSKDEFTTPEPISYRDALSYVGDGRLGRQALEGKLLGGAEGKLKEARAHLTELERQVRQLNEQWLRGNQRLSEAIASAERRASAITTNADHRAARDATARTFASQRANDAA